MKDHALRLAFCFFVLGFALFHFADNVADPDLWGHVLFGQRMIRMKTIERADPFSWTAPGAPWINHEVLAEVALGGVHQLAGGTGILFLKLFIGMLTFWIALRMGSELLAWPWRAVAWVIGFIAAVEIAFGFAARPQIFSALGLAVLLWMLRRVYAGRIRWAFALPLLFAAWINTHGGALAGLLVLGTSFAAVSAEALLKRRGALETRTLVPLGLAVALSAAALLVNPWGWRLPAWLVESVRWVRPEIHEWNPARLDLDRLPFFTLAGLSLAAFAFSRRRREPWEAAVVGILAVMAFRHVRHTPLFSIAALSFIPPHAADAIQRIRSHVARLETCVTNAKVQRAAVPLLALAGAGCIVAAGTLHKERAWTMEVPRDVYPVSAVRFMQEHELKGNLVVFFDWGEMAIWELPDCPVSLDGRLDTSYPRDVIAANWTLYRGTPPDPSVLDLRKAELALLPRELPGAQMLVKKFRWKLAYEDPLAVVLIRNTAQQPGLADVALPVQQGMGALAGRAAFPRMAKDKQ